jgi:hypothetical protein
MVIVAWPASSATWRMSVRVTKEAPRRLRTVPDGDDLVRETYASEEFRARAAAFLRR